MYACEFVGPGGRQMVTASADELALWDVETRQRVDSSGSIAVSTDLAGGAPTLASAMPDWCRYEQIYRVQDLQEVAASFLARNITIS